MPRTSSSSTSTTTSTALPAQSPEAAANTTYQTQLSALCQYYNYKLDFEIITDRRGGRTAWSCLAYVQGEKTPARFWYDGQYVNNAKEDAAQVALIRMGALQNTGRYPIPVDVGGGKGQGKVVVG